MTIQSLSPRVQAIVNNIQALNRAELHQLFNIIAEWLAGVVGTSQPQKRQITEDGQLVLKYFGCWPDMPDDFVDDITVSRAHYFTGREVET